MKSPCEGFDKRTNDYKNCIEAEKRAKAEAEDGHEVDLPDLKTETKGLGDAVEVVAKLTGVKALVDKLFGKDCGCDERKERLNKLKWFQKSNRLELHPEEFIILHRYFSKGNKLRVFDSKVRNELIPMHNRLFWTQYDIGTSCQSCLKDVSNKLFTTYKAYVEEK